jgi:type IV pilus assembly protein PilO
MALGLPTDQRGQILALLILVALTGGYFFWTKFHAPDVEKISIMNDGADSLEAIVAAAKADLASGSIEDLRRRVEEYQGSLELMRRLVPERNEVPTLIDDISTKAKVRGVTIGRFQPLSPEPGSPFDTYRYRLEVYGHYDQLGEYLADIASLPRIVVPQDVSLSPASPQAQKLLADTAGALLLAEFSIRTFVKAAAPPPGTQPAARGGQRARS